MSTKRARCLVLSVVCLLSCVFAESAFAASEISVVREWDDVEIPNGGSFGFGLAPANTSDSRRFRIHNTGNTNLVISNPTTLVSGEGFSMIADPVGTVHAGMSTTFRVQFLASTPGDYYGAITIQNNDSDENPYVIHLYGGVTAPPSPDIAVVRNWDDVAVPSGGSFSFGTGPANTPDSRIFRIHNTGNANLDISNPTTLVSGEGFSMIAYPVGTVHAGESTIFRVQFVASAPGDYNGAITIHSNDSDENPYVIQLHGAVTAPSLPEIAVFRDWDNVAVPDSGSFTFPNPVVAGSADSRRFRITNTGSAPLALANPATLVSGTCFSQMETPASPIAAGASAWFQVRILCSTPGTYTGTVSIQNNDADENPYDFTVSGTVVPSTPQAPEIALYRHWDNVAVSDGGSYVYPAPVPPGQADLRTFRIENSGSATLTIANPGSLVSGTCFSQSGAAPASSIAPGGSTTFTVQLLCSNAGTYNGAVTIQNNDGNENPYDVALQGVVGTTADFNVSVRPEFMRVQRGKSITATVSVAGLFGFNSPVSLSAIDLPAGTTASFQPASISPGASSTLTIHAAASGPFGDFSIRVRGTSGGLTRNMTATLRVMDPLAKPAITAIQPETIPAGESSTVTLTGTNFHTSEVTVGNAGADRAFPTIEVVEVSADGTRMKLLVDATDPSVLHHYGLYVKNIHGEDGISFRVIPAAPVIDYWSPSEAAGGTLYAMDLVGVNLQGATVVSPGGVSVFDVDNSEDELLSAFLKVEAGAPNGPINLIIRGRDGGDATIRVEILQQRKNIRQKTSAMTDSKGEPLFYMQELKAREDLQPGLAKNPASVHGGFDFSICAEWSRSRSRGRVYTRTWFKDPLTGEYGPLADVLLDNLRIGEVRILETLTFSRWFYIELSMYFRVCLSEDWGLDYDAEACITGEAGFHIPIVGGLALEFEFCLGSPSRYEIDLTGTGFLRFIQFHRRGNTGPEPLQCVQIRDVNPESGSGERIFEVELMACCTEAVGASWSGDFYLGTMTHPNQEVGTATPAPAACALHTVTIDHPPHNPNPPDLGNNFSFLAQRRFADTANGDTIQASATVTPAVNDLNRMTWTITPTVGAIRLLTPADGRGATVSFVPDPPDHDEYIRGTGCNNPGNGSCARSTPLGYRIAVQYEDHQDANQIVQDQIDTIRQEYRNHDITIPRRSEFNTVLPTLNFDVNEINNTAYAIVVGTPGAVAQNVRDEYNRRIHDDIQLQPFGMPGLPPGAPIVGPGANVDEFGPILTTPRCNGAPNPAACDDVRAGNMILAGNNGIVETRAEHRVTNLPIEINSGWRNPERNEAVNGVLHSNHQYGGALDLDNELPREGLTTAQLFCILQTAADAAGYNGFAERFATQIRCNSALVTHVHVQPR